MKKEEIKETILLEVKRYLLLMGDTDRSNESLMEAHSLVLGVLSKLYGDIYGWDDLQKSTNQDRHAIERLREDIEMTVAQQNFLIFMRHRDEFNEATKTKKTEK